jgi:methylmalonyl-CoA mutase C-terminal domain/subunit
MTERPKMTTKKKTRILLSKLGLDGHDRGVKVLAALLMKGGFEVTYLGLYNTPDMVVQSALEEDVDVIGISFLSGEHLTLTPKIVAEMRKNRMEDVLLIVGGIIPAVDEDALLKMGVKKVFCGSLVGDVAAYLNQYFGLGERIRKPLL